MIEYTFERRMKSADVAEMAPALGTLGSIDEDSAELIDQISGMEALKATVSAAQARATAAFAAKQRAAQRAAGVPARDVGKGIAAQVALARRDSPRAGGRHLGLAEALVSELPQTMAALESGQISEWRAIQVCRETACLSVEHRAQVDAELAARPGRMAAMGDKQIAVEARRIGYRLDARAVTNRASKATNDRHVTIRPAPDTMAWLTALLPPAQAVAAYASLRKAADSARAVGDERGRARSWPTPWSSVSLAKQRPTPCPSRYSWS